MSLKALFILGAILAILKLGAAEHDPTFLLGDDPSAPRAKTAFFKDTELACMNQVNFKNCRYTGCPVADLSCHPDSLYFQSDFTCCPKHHFYRGGEDSGEWNDIAVTANEIGTCDWEISMYRTPFDIDGTTDNWTPHLSDDGTTLKWGTAIGTCHLNAGAEHCNSPLCERMTITVQGGLYVACAYSNLPTGVFYDVATAEEVCTGNPPAWLQALINNKKRKQASTQQSSHNSTIENEFEHIMEDSALILSQTCGAAQNRRHGFFSKKTQGQGQAASIMGGGSSDDQQYYPGIAMILSGPMQVGSKKDDKLDENGMFELTVAFDSGANALVEPVNRWPVVKARGAKLRFTREREEHY